MKLLNPDPALEKVIPQAVLAHWPDDIYIVALTGAPTQALPAKTIAVVEHMPVATCIDLIQKFKIPHLVQRDNPQFMHEINAAAHMLSDPFCLSKDPGIELMGKPVESYTIKFDAYSEKANVIDEVANYLKIVPRTAAVLDDALTIVDELFTNALFNTRLPRETRTAQDRAQFKSTKTSQIFLYTDLFQLVVGCRDPFGVMDPEKVVSRLDQTYKVGMGKAMREEPRLGAGLGLRMALDIATSFYISINQGKETLICCSMPLRQSQSEKENCPKNFHCSWFRGEKK